MPTDKEDSQQQNSANNSANSNASDNHSSADDSLAISDEQWEKINKGSGQQLLEDYKSLIEELSAEQVLKRFLADEKVTDEHINELISVVKQAAKNNYQNATALRIGDAVLGSMIQITAKVAGIMV